MVPASPEAAFAAALAIPLPRLLHRRYGPFPPIREVTGQAGWARAGDSRTIIPAGGGTMRETLTLVDEPREFGYTVTEITGPMALLVGHVDGNWAFTATGAGTRVTWRWALHPKSGLAVPAVWVLGRLWNGYARQALESLADFLRP